MSGRKKGAWGFWGQVFKLAGGVGLISPWLPDPSDSAASDDLTGMALVWWMLVCLGMVALGMLFDQRAEDGRWPCWLKLGHRYQGVDNGWIVCRECGHGEKLDGWDPERIDREES